MLAGVLAFTGIVFTGEKNLKADDFYGTYYGISEEYTIFELNVAEGKVDLINRSYSGKSNTLTFNNNEHSFYTAEYVAHKNQLPEFDICGAIHLKHTNDTLSYWVYIIDDTPGNVTFKILLNSGDYLELTETEKTMKQATNDPENYYGTYEFSPTNKLTINEDSCSIIWNGKSPETYTYIYADQALLRHLGIEDGESGIIAFEGSDSYYWFVFDGDDLVFRNTNRFVKQ